MAQAIPRGYGSQCQGGAGVRGFSRSGKPRLLLSLIPVGRSFPTRPSLSTLVTVHLVWYGFVAYQLASTKKISIITVPHFFTTQLSAWQQQ